MILHLVHLEKADSNALKACLEYIRSEDTAVLLIGAEHLDINTLFQQFQNKSVKLKFLPTSKAISSRKKMDTRQINYQELVNLSSTHSKVISWF